MIGVDWIKLEILPCHQFIRRNSMIKLEVEITNIDFQNDAEQSKVKTTFHTLAAIKL